jgi:hypothetical protein
MPRYHFHSSTNSRFTDDEGVECATPLDARKMAIRTCGEMIHGCEDAFWGSRPWTITVTDAAGTIMYEIAVDGYASEAAGASNE